MRVQSPSAEAAQRSELSPYGGRRDPLVEAKRNVRGGLAVDVPGPHPLLVTVDRGTRRAGIASALFAQSRLGISRVSYVGLSGREAVHLLVAARYHYGLRSHLRRRGGQLSITLVAPTHEV